MKQSAQNIVARWRHLVLMLLLAAVVIGLGVRILQLMLFDRDFLLHQGNARSLRTVTIPAHRGTIYDRNGEPLAITIPVQSVAANPQEVNPESLPKLAEALQLDLASLQQRIDKSSGKEFVYLRRIVDPDVVRKVTALDLPGVFLQKEHRRYYPSSEVAVHVVGFTNIDDQGLEGLELAYDSWLRGVPGKKRVIKDRLGHVVEDLNIIRNAKPGKDIMLSIDKRIQYAAYQELKTALDFYEASSGSIVILDVRTGEVLAMVNYPSFNPNVRPRPQGGAYRNRAVTDVFEPGSTIKPFTVAMALASGEYLPDTLVDTSPGWINLDGNRVKDPHNLGSIDVTTILQKSSNVGVAKLALSFAPDALWHLFHRLGFGQRTASGFPGESAGKLSNHTTWHPFALATLSFGYGMSVTALQLAQAYALLATDGLKHPISFIRIDQPNQVVEKRILAPRVAESVLGMLEKVIEQGGTGTRASVPGYRITGKTGTVRMVGPQGYMPGHHIAIFAGIAPASQPRLVSVVVLNDPQSGKYYGGVIAAPVFSKVMSRALRIMNIMPDNLATRKDNDADDNA